ncbi:hypothetical protein G7046_g4267 [Stylonectria norvegica]|nr:hypothetical protein G7046_g4267 [Stylonectria norvegica]
MATPSADLMSSPDPLNDEAISNTIVPSSAAHRVTRSQRSSRFASLGVSPRKQTFELQVGNDISPRKLLVTVETDDGLLGAGGSRRKLFESSSPMSLTRRSRATTTTVPLRETIEEEVATPRRRGRPRKTNGTPLPGAGTKRRAGTPIQNTPRRARTVKTTEAKERQDASREASAQPTPRSARRGRPPKKRAIEGSSELGTNSTKGTTPRKRGRPRRQELVPEELVEMVDKAAEESFQVEEPETVNDVIIVRRPSEEPDEEDGPHAEVQSVAEPESDIWMATLDDDATPRATRRTAQATQGPSPGEQQRESLEPNLEADTSVTGDYGYSGAAGSEVSSVDEPPTESGARGNDTIAQGEDFSMIFMDSIPSLRGLNSSVHVPADDVFGDETSLIISNTLQSIGYGAEHALEVERAESQEPSLPVLPQPAPAEPRPSATRPPLSLSPTRNRGLSPMWSSSPRRGAFSPLRQQVLKFKARQAEDDAANGAQNALDGRLQPRLQHQRISGRIHDEETAPYEDSFSEIPQQVLQAATPGRPAATLNEEDSKQDDEDMEEMDIEQSEHYGGDQPALQTASNNSVVSRLPTPDDTPPHNDIEATDNQGKSTQESQSSHMATSPTQPQAVSQVLEEVVEEYDESLAEIPEQQRSAPPLGKQPLRMEVTPSNQITSPVQEPQSLVPEVVQDKVARPALSPIVRAGRALQSVTSDPPSPEVRDTQLRSPFRSSASKESGPGSRGLSISPRRQLAFPAVTQIPPPSQAYEDPFGADRRHTGQVSFMEALSKSGSVRTQKSHVSSRGSNASSMRITPPSEAMSWVANEGPISDALRGDVPLKALASSTLRVEPDTISYRQFDGPADNTDEKPQDRDDETDIWEFEAERAAPQPPRQQPFGKKVLAPGRRRGTLPSPWTKQNTRAAHNTTAISRPEDEPVSDPDGTEEAVEEEHQADEYSLLAQRANAQHPIEAPQSVAKASRFDLSAFFSSPAAIPGKLAGKLLPAKTASIFGVKTKEPKSETEPVAGPSALPTSSMFPQVPQKEFRPRSASRTNLFSSVQESEPDASRQERDIASPSTPERLVMPVVAQKKDFTPRPRQISQTVPQPAPAQTGATTPPRMQLSHADIARWQQQTSNASEDSPEASERLLRPLPARNASPSKSSLRSPLKAHTPGRVVEFTSSVLSPVEQAKSRHQRRLSNAPASQLSVALQLPPRQTDDKENHKASDVTMSDASPLAKSPQVETLSHTVWTRQHWLLLDELLQLRREGPYEPPYERRCDRFLGKTVKSQGEAMSLERWHLDCVDAFRAEVGGWDEAALVKRLFALILGEERRSRGVVERPARVMFH